MPVGGLFKRQSDFGMAMKKILSFTVVFLSGIHFSFSQANVLISDGVSTNQTLVGQTNIGVVTVNDSSGKTITFESATSTPLGYGLALSNAVVYANNTAAAGNTNVLIQVAAGAFDLSGYFYAFVPMKDGVSIQGEGIGQTIFIAPKASSQMWPFQMGSFSEAKDFSLQDGMYIGLFTNGKRNCRFSDIYSDGSAIDGVYVTGRQNTNDFFDLDLNSDYDAFNVFATAPANRNSQEAFNFYNSKLTVVSDVNTHSSFTNAILRAFAVTTGSNSVYHLYGCTLSATANVLSNGYPFGQCDALSFGQPGGATFLTGVKVYLHGCTLSSSSTKGTPFDINFLGTNCTVYIDHATVWDPTKVNWGGAGNAIVYMDNIPNATNPPVAGGFLYSPNGTNSAWLTSVVTNNGTATLSGIGSTATDFGTFKRNFTNTSGKTVVVTLTNAKAVAVFDNAGVNWIPPSANPSVVILQPNGYLTNSTGGGFWHAW